MAIAKAAARAAGGGRRAAGCGLRAGGGEAGRGRVDMAKMCAVCVVCTCWSVC